jgi:ribonuclease P protein subunit RPR2
MSSKGQSTSDIKENVKEKKSKSPKIKPRGRTGRRTKEMVAIAKRRIQILLNLAERESVSNKNQKRAKRYVQLARNLSMRYNIKMQKYYRYKFCRSCNTYLGSNETCSVRVQNGKIIIHCKICGRMKRIHIH